MPGRNPKENRHPRNAAPCVQKGGGSIASGSPISRYLQDMEQRGFIADSEQERIFRKVQCLYEQLTCPPPPTGGMRRLKSWLGFDPLQTRVRGMYLYGGVGRGKTYIVDTLFAVLPKLGKRRVHFHRFMEGVHTELKRCRNLTDPLARVARRWAKDVRLLCLDEFQVTDIADAMLLGRLLEHLFACGTVLVTTSNIAPDALYEGGLQRIRFLPTIELIKSQMDVVHMADGTDYRLRTLVQAKIYHWPLGPVADAALEKGFDRLAVGAMASRGSLSILDRRIPTVRWIAGVAWFRFAVLCRGPRGTADYIEIGRCFHTVLVQGLPELGDEDPDVVVRFINMIDEFYDRRVNLLMSAAVAIEHIYAGQRFAQRFQRTRSRLGEMQSAAYLAQEHLP